MKNILLFLFGALAGAGGTFLWFHKEIKKELNEQKVIRAEAVAANVKNNTSVEKTDESIPFTVDEHKPEAIKEQTRTAYYKMVDDVEAGVTPPIPVPLRPVDCEPGESVYEIDKETFQNDEKWGFEQERLVYFKGDHILSSEQGTIISNPFMLIGNQWEAWVGKYVPNTAFVRNPKLVTDYEVYVEYGLYTDEYGPIQEYRED